MKLKELLKTIPDDDWLYIGAASGFVFIGQKHEAKKKLREAEKYYFNAYTKYKQDADARIKNHPQIMEKKQALLAAAKENGDAKEIAKCEHGISNVNTKPPLNHRQNSERSWKITRNLPIEKFWIHTNERSLNRWERLWLSRVQKSDSIGCIVRWRNETDDLPF